MMLMNLGLVWTDVNFNPDIFYVVMVFNIAIGFIAIIGVIISLGRNMMGNANSNCRNRRHLRDLHISRNDYEDMGFWYFNPHGNKTLNADTQFVISFRNHLGRNTWANFAREENILSYIKNSYFF